MRRLLIFGGIGCGGLLVLVYFLAIIGSGQSPPSSPAEEAKRLGKRIFQSAGGVVSRYDVGVALQSHAGVGVPWKLLNTPSGRGPSGFRPS